MARVSDTLIGRLRRHRPQYQIAASIGTPPTWLSRLVRGEVEPQDPRIHRLGRLLGLRDDELFEPDVFEA